MDNDVWQVLKWLFLIVIVFVVMWFLLQIVQELNDDVNSGVILWEGLW